MRMEHSPSLAQSIWQVTASEFVASLHVEAPPGLFEFGILSAFAARGGGSWERAILKIQALFLCHGHGPREGAVKYDLLLVHSTHK